MRYWIGALVALALALLALWSVTRSGETPRTSADRELAPAASPAELETPERSAHEPTREPVPRDAARTTPATAAEPSAFPSSELAGRVQHADGRPAVGIALEVRAQGASERTRPLVSATSAVDGSFSVTCLGRGPFLLRAHRSDRRGTRFEAHLSVDRGAARDLRLTLPALATLSGRVRDERGESIPRFRIELDGPDGLRLRLPVSVDDGTFQVEELAAGPWTLVVEADGHAALELGTVELPAKPLDLVLARECRLRGRVLGPDGEPCEDARVTAAGFSRDTTDARGAFALHGPAGEVELRATSTAAAASGELVLTAEPGEVRTDLVLALRPAPPLPVRDEPSQRVELPAGEVVELPPRPAPVPVRVSGRITKGGKPATLRRVSFADTEGRWSGQARLEGAGFELELPHAGAYVLRVQLDTCAWRQSLDIAPERAEPLDLDVPVGWIEGIAREGSRGLAGATVQASGANGGAETTTDVAGNFCFEVPAGTLTLTLMLEGTERYPYDVHVEAGQRCSGIEFVREVGSPVGEERGRTVRVRARSGSERPLDVDAIDTSGRVFDFGRSFAPSDAAPDAADRPSTWFLKNDLEPGEYRVRVWTKSESSLHPMTLRAGSGSLTWELELP